MIKTVEAVVADETAPLSEAALAGWSRPEEGVAWSHLQSPNGLLRQIVQRPQGFDH